MDVHLEEKVNSLMLHGLEPQVGGGSGDEVNVSSRSVDSEFG